MHTTFRCAKWGRWPPCRTFSMHVTWSPGCRLGVYQIDRCLTEAANCQISTLDRFIGRALESDSSFAGCRNDAGRVYSILKNWPERRVKAVCLTDGERVGALGDLGVQAVGVPISKLALYSACAGIPPTLCLPVCIDAGECPPCAFLLSRECR